jgi:hypothetical protein
MSDRYGFRLDKDRTVIDKAFGVLPFETLEAAEHTGEKFRWDSIEYVVTHDDGKTWEYASCRHWQEPCTHPATAERGEA